MSGAAWPGTDESGAVGKVVVRRWWVVARHCLLLFFLLILLERIFGVWRLDEAARVPVLDINTPTLRVMSSQ